MNKKLYEEINDRIRSTGRILKEEMKNRDSLLNLDDMEDYYIANARVSFYQGIMQGLISAAQIINEIEMGRSDGKDDDDSNRHPAYCWSGNAAGT